MYIVFFLVARRKFEEATIQYYFLLCINNYDEQCMGLILASLAVNSVTMTTTMESMLDDCSTVFDHRSAQVL